MRACPVLLLCLLGAVLLHPVLCSHGKGPKDCCVQFYPRRIGRNSIKSYRETDPRCGRNAVIFVTRRGSEICMDPTWDWVYNMTLSLDQQSL